MKMKLKIQRAKEVLNHQTQLEIMITKTNLDSTKVQAKRLEAKVIKVIIVMRMHMIMIMVQKQVNTILEIRKWI